MKKSILVVLQLFLILIWQNIANAEGGTGNGRGRSAMRNPLGGPPLVSVAKLVRGDINLVQDGLGTVTPSSSALVRTRVDGQLIKLHYTEGQWVTAGEVLAELDPRPFQVALEQAEGQLARDDAQLQNAKIDLERYQTLWKQDSIAKQTLDGQAALVRQYEGLVSADKGNVDNAKLQLDYASIKAPISGRVGLKQVDSGNLVHQSDANGIVLITQIKPIDVVFSVPEEIVPTVSMKLNNQEKLVVEAYDKGQRHLLATGELITLDNQIDSSTGTIKLKARFKNENVALYPAQFVNIRLLLESRKNVVLLPTAALQHNLEGDYVFTVDADKTVHQQAIKLGVGNATNVEVISGLAQGDQVVVEGGDRIHTGSKVETADYDTDNNLTENKSTENKSAENSSAATDSAADNSVNTNSAKVKP